MTKKKILYICQYFYPEVFRGNDIAFHMAEIGNEVHVVAGTPNYPMGKFYKGYGIFKNNHEYIKGVKVTRLPIFPRGKNKIMLMLNYFSFFIVSYVWMLFHAMFHKYDIVFVQQLSPVMMSASGILYKRIRKVPLYTWVLDIWPESLTAAGGITNKWVLGFFNIFVKNEYKYSDKILVSSRSFEKSIITYGDYQDKIIYYPQWGDGSSNSNVGDFEFPELPKGFIVMFAGAVGEAHGMDTNLQAALLTKKFPEIKWVIVGDGRKIPWVRNFINDNHLENTVFTLGRFPAEMMPYFFEKADVMLVSLNDSPLFNLYAPAKISSYMASAKPIITILNGEGANVVHDAKCGWNVSAGDYESLAILVIELSKMAKSILKEKGNNGLAYYKDNFDKGKCLEVLDKIMGLI